MSGRHARPILNGWPLAIFGALWPFLIYGAASIAAVLLVLYVLEVAL